MEIREFKDTIEFTNKGQLSLFFIGTGNSFSHKYFQSNVLIVKGQTHIMVDCGTLFSYALDTCYNTKTGDVRNLILTHPHADHVGGVEEMCFVSRYVKKQKVNLIIPDSFKKTLWNDTLKGGIHYSEIGLLKFEDYFNQIKPEKLKNKPFEMHNIDFGNLNIKLFRTKHVVEKENSFYHSQISYGLIIDNRILFTGDTLFNPQQLSWILENYDIEYIFHDCDMLGHGEVHATYDSLKTLEPKVKEKMLLYHYNSAIEGIDPTKDGFAGFTQRGVYYDF